MKLKKLHFGNFSFGATAGIVTSLALLVGLSRTTKMSVISSLVVLALIDNIVDTFGIHIYQESINPDKKILRAITTNNFITRFLITFSFILLVFFLPIKLAVIISLILGMCLILLMSFAISKNHKVNPYPAMLHHLLFAALVILASNYLGLWINHIFAN